MTGRVSQRIEGMSLRSDRLKKLEAELRDLEQWLKLGLVPKKDIPKHSAEIESTRAKIAEEQEKLRFLKESGELEEYVTPRKAAGRTQYTDMPTLPEIDIVDEANTPTDTNEPESDSLFETSFAEERSEEEEPSEEVTEDEDPFSDRNRWRRGMLHPDEDEW